MRRQMPTSLRRLPSSRAPSTSSRRNRTFPCEPITRRWTAPRSTGPPRTASRSCSTEEASRPLTSRRSTASSFHSATIGSGAGSSLRRVATTRAAPVAAIWWTSVAERSSRRWASSTERTRGRPPAESTRKPAQRRRRSARSPTPPSGPDVSGGSSGANAPSGSGVAARVAVTRATDAPDRSRTVRYSAARRVLPTPAGPASTTPRTEPAWMPWRRRSSPARPTSGHCPPTVCQCRASRPVRHPVDPIRPVRPS